MNATTPFAWQSSQVVNTGERASFYFGDLIDLADRYLYSIESELLEAGNDPSHTYLDLRAVLLVYVDGDVKYEIGYDGGYKMTVNFIEFERNNELLCRAVRRSKNIRIKRSARKFCCHWCPGKIATPAATPFGVDGPRA